MAEKEQKEDHRALILMLAILILWASYFTIPSVKIFIKDFMSRLEYFVYDVYHFIDDAMRNAVKTENAFTTSTINETTFGAWTTATYSTVSGSTITIVYSTSYTITP